jgi:GMP synthase (glutamine-hydrolysing)
MLRSIQPEIVRERVARTRHLAMTSTVTPAKVLLFHNGPMPAAIDALHGTFEVQVANSLAACGITERDVALEVVRTFDQGYERVASIDGTQYATVILSGSVADVTQSLPWMHVLADWIRKHVGKVPMLGICFGHQIIGHALGGEVMHNPRGYEVGTFEAETVDAAAQAADPLASQLPPKLKIALMHAQSVERLPEGAVAFYRTDNEKHQMVRFSKDTYGCQFHPEFTSGFVRDLAPYLSFGNSTEADLDRLARVEDTPMSMSIIGRFVRLYMPSASAVTSN